MNINSKLRSLSILFVSTFLFLFISTCQQQPNEPANSLNQNEAEKVILEKSNTADTKDLELSFKDNGGGKKGEDSIGIKALPCGLLYKYYWQFERFNNIQGKIVGIWPTENRLGNISKINELKNTWGFNFLASSLHYYNNYINAGYQPSNVMALINIFDNQWVTAVQEKPHHWGYYTDEPITNHGFLQGLLQMEFASNYFRQYYSGS